MGCLRSTSFKRLRKLWSGFEKKYELTTDDDEHFGSADVKDVGDALSAERCGSIVPESATASCS